MLITFIALAAVFALLGPIFARQAAKRKLSQSVMICSLAAANLSFSGAILAVLYSASYYRGWAFILPIAFSFAMLLVYQASKHTSRGGLTLSEMNRLFRLPNSEPSKFAVYYGISWFFFLALLIGWELYVASQVLTPVLFSTNSQFFQFSLAIGCMLFISIYTYLGGLYAVMKSDVFQLILGILCCILIWSNWRTGGNAPLTSYSSYLIPTKDVSNAIWFAVEILAINVCFQVPHRMYWHYIQIAKQHSHSVGRILFWGTAIPFAIWVFFICLGVSYSAATGNPAYPDLVSATKSWQGYILVLAVIGLTFSTIDSYLLSAALTLQELRQIYSLGSRSSETDQIDAPSATRTRLVFVIAAVAITLTFVLMRYVNNVFQSFLAISGAMGAFAPVVLLPMFRGKSDSTCWERSERRALLLFLLFALSCASQIVVFLANIRHGTPIIVIATIVIAFGIFLPSSRGKMKTNA